MSNPAGGVPDPDDEFHVVTVLYVIIALAVLYVLIVGAMSL